MSTDHEVNQGLSKIAELRERFKNSPIGGLQERFKNNPISQLQDRIKSGPIGELQERLKPLSPSIDFASVQIGGGGGGCNSSEDPTEKKQFSCESEGSNQEVSYRPTRCTQSVCFADCTATLSLSKKQLYISSPSLKKYIDLPNTRGRHDTDILAQILRDGFFSTGLKPVEYKNSPYKKSCERLNKWASSVLPSVQGNAFYQKQGIIYPNFKEVKIASSRDFEVSYNEECKSHNPGGSLFKRDEFGGSLGEATTSSERNI